MHHEEELTPAQTKERIVALLLVFAVVIFFWMPMQHLHKGPKTNLFPDYSFAI